MARRYEADTETHYFVPAQGWGASETLEATIKLVNEKVYSFSQYNENTFYRRDDDGEWVRIFSRKPETVP